MKPYLLECCVDSVESAVAACQGGADRLELCRNLVIGGTTPEIEFYREVRKAADIKINVLLRPRFGDFLYSPAEKEILKREAALFKKEGADGIVIGCLTSDGILDEEFLKELIEAGEGMSVTLHRAFDVSRDAFYSLEQAKRLNVDTILTSGQQESCVKGRELLKELLSQAGDITIMVGGGVNAQVISSFLEDTRANTFHMSGKIVLESQMSYRNPNVSMGLPGFSEYQIWQTDKEQVRLAKKVLDEKFHSQ